MIRRIMILIIIYFHISHAGINDWELINPQPTTNTYFNIFKTNGNTLIAIGKHELILVSNDNGENWRRIEVDTAGIPFYPDISFSEMDFIDEFGLVLEGRGHLLLKTQNYGEDWEFVPNFDLSFYCNDLYLTTKQIGFIVGYKATIPNYGQIYKTSDSGLSWQQMYESQNSKFNNINVFPDSIGYVHDANNLLKTTNMGQNWNLVFSIDTVEIQDLFFENSIIGYLILNDGTILKTEDGANSFSIFHTFSSYTFGGYFEGNTAHILSFPNIVYSTADSGQTWHTTYLPTNGLIMLKLNFFNPDTGFVVGNYGEIYKTYDAGLTWDRMKKSFTDDSFYDLSFATEDEVFAAARTGIYKTIDKGHTWQKLPNLPNRYFSSISFPSDQIGFASAYEIFKTVDGGSQWTSVFNPNENINKIRFVNDQLGIIIGSNGTVYKTSDGGIVWENISVPFQLELNGLFVLNDSCYTVIGYNGSIFQTHDGGNSWNYYQTSQLDGFEDVDFLDSMNGIVVGQKSSPVLEGLVYRTVDGGQTWEKQTSNTWWRLETIDFYSDSIAIAAGSEGAMIYSNDGGFTWNLINQDICNLYYSVKFLDASNVLAVGQLGMVVINDDFLTDISLKNIKHPQHFALHQNFPNPFNIETTISFYLPKPSHTELEIYDITGRYINTLISRRLLEGEHNVVWTGLNSSGNEVSSGIYIYRLKTEKYFQSRKLILLK